MENTEERIANHWSNKELRFEQPSSWKDLSKVMMHMNKKLCGEPIAGGQSGLLLELQRKLDGRIMQKGISVGCGNALKEINLVHNRVVEEFTCFELSDVRLEKARDNVRRVGLDDNFTLVLGDAFSEVKNGTQEYDFVHWNNSLHHMFDTDSAVKWSKSILQEGGIFFMFEFIGENRFQWSDQLLDLCNKVRKILPESYYSSLTKDKRLLQRVNLDRIINDDPSEAVDSENIIPAVERHFGSGGIKLLGGAVYRLVLKDIAKKFFDEKSQPYLDLILDVDDLMSDLGHNHLASAIIQVADRSGPRI